VTTRARTRDVPGEDEPGAVAREGELTGLPGEHVAQSRDLEAVLRVQLANDRRDR